MTWYSEHFFWRPWKSKYDSSLHLYIDDGFKIRLQMDDCRANDYFECVCEGELNHKCGHENWAFVDLSREELQKLHEATGKALEYLKNERKK